MVAMASNGVIGRDNGLPWHLPEDLRYFKRTTLGKPVIMGRRTFESIGRPLPGRPNIVVSRSPAWSAAGVTVADSLVSALDRAQELATAGGVQEIVVIGGAQIYAAALPLASRLYVTEVHAAVAGDTWFPPMNSTEWREVAREEHEATADNPYPYAFVVCDRLLP
ncbi:dihydrofolate reductase [Haliea sp. E1-2-M8]|uniref:dihydrofolate reductase n=1 Tax=Haliea sp. E1-2-M8 TaxID=3064706 RepID=UPI0027258889|nr:dihydrofolate reductase [Haliea sp. E1-2-M8]MDO8860244.1 dihydrofolate reductase [Haliea sp. E1-2-M8]